MLRRKADQTLNRLGLLAHAVGAACAVAAGVAVWAVTCLPLKSGNDESRRQLTAALELLRDSRAIRQSFASTRAQHDAMRRELEQVRRRIPPNSDEAQFLNDVAAMAGEVGFSIAEFHPGQVSEAHLCRQMDVRLRGTGPYASICRFLTGLSELDRLARIRSMKLSIDGAQEGQYVLEVTLVLYFAMKPS